MEIIHKLLNILAPIFTFFSLLFFWPPFQLFKFFHSLLATVFSEDVAGKVVLITGASSGIGEHLAYEYARRGAYLALCARRENRLVEVADMALELGSPDVIVIGADVSNVNDCRRVIDRTMNRYGRLDHLVNNAGITSTCMLEEVDDIANFKSVMDINFWGSVYMTRFTIPYLRHSRGRIVVVSSASSWLPSPRQSFYNASKAAMSQFFETLRIEFGSDIGITLVTPGFIESEVTQGKYLLKGGIVEVDQEIRDVNIGPFPVEKVEGCAEAIVKAALRGERYLTEPPWFKFSYLWKVFAPEILEWTYRILNMTNPGESPNEALSKKILDYTGAQKIAYPDSIQALEEKERVL